MKKIGKFFAGVINELKKVRWPDKKSMLKYTIATIVFVVVLAGFFYVIDVVVALVRTLV